jgi:hypothetical protein
MRVAVASAHRNNELWLPKYFLQIARLRTYLESYCSIRVIMGEGDSADGTREALIRQAQLSDIDFELLNCDHGGPEFGSTEAPERMKALSAVGNALFEAVKPEDDVLVYIESDLIWSPPDIARLVWAAENKSAGFDVFAPMVMAHDLFYDIWGFRGLDGRRFDPVAPHFPGMLGNDFFEIGSAGSCLVMKGEVARACRIRNDYCLVGWCQDAREKGYRIAVRTDCSVRQA